MTVIHELQKLFDNKHYIGNFYLSFNEAYWSSSEVDSQRAWTIYFVNGSVIENYKTNPWHIRPIRYF